MKKTLLLITLLFAFVLSSCTIQETQGPEYSYTVYFDSMEGSLVKPMKVTDQSVSELPIPLKEGYTFLGWYTTKEYTERVIGLREASEEVSLDVTIFAKWEETIEVFTITFHYFDGTTKEKEAPLGDPGRIGFPPGVEGYTFVGWFYEPTFETEFIRGTILEEDIDLYAKMRPMKTYAYILFNNKMVDRVLLDFGETYTLMESYSLDGFTFDGFYEDPEFVTEITEVVGGVTRKDVYAKFNLALESIDITTLPYYGYLNENNPVVEITVQDIGVMRLQLFPDIAPNTVNNYLSYIQNNLFLNSEFHRVISGFMIQGGITDTTTCSIAGEFSSNGFENDLSHTRGVLSMARTNVMDSATSQFFIVHEDSVYLDGNYASFGGVTSGFNVLDYIAWQFTNDYDYPNTPIVIENVTVELNGYQPHTVVCAEES